MDTFKNFSSGIAELLFAWKLKLKEIPESKSTDFSRHFKLHLSEIDALMK